jgi:type II secretory pathway component PulF
VKFVYQAFDAVGKAVSGSAEAPDANDAMEALRRQGLYVTSVQPTDAGGGTAARDAAVAGSSAPAARRATMSRHKQLKNLAMFTRQLSVLMTSGTPLVQALGSLERQSSEKPWRDVVGTLRAKVEEGATLAQAMEIRSDVFDPVCRSLIAAGESGGSFGEMLERLATLTRRQMHVRNAVVGALIYPALLVFVAFGVLATMLLFVLPRFAGLFQTLDVTLPPTTRFLMTLSEFLRGYWWSLPLAGIVFGFLGHSWIKSPTGRRWADTVVLKLPMIGPILKSFAVARIARVLGVLLNGRVPLLEALSLARHTARNVNYVDLVARAEDAVTKGGSVSTAFAAGNLVSPSLCEAIRSGEQSGQMAPLLLSIADFLDEDNEVVLKSLTSILEPVILIVLGVLVGFVALSMFMPLFDLTSMTQGGH